MKLGIEAGAFTLDIAVEQHVRGVPISADDLATNGLLATLAPLRSRGLQVCQIGAFGYNPLSSDLARREQQREMLMQVIPLAADTGCRYIVICGGNYHPSGFAVGDACNYSDQALDDVAKQLEPLVVFAEQHSVVLSIEPYLKTAIYSAERFISLWRRLGSNSLRINIDVTSLYAYWDYFNPSPLIAETCNRLAGHYGLMHIKEIGLQEGFHIHMSLVPLGQGTTDWKQVLTLCAPHLPADSWVILEHVQSVDEAKSSLTFLRRCSKEVGIELS